MRRLELIQTQDTLLPTSQLVERRATDAAQPDHNDVVCFDEPDL